MFEEYIGCPTQCSGVEEYRLVGGRGDNMRLYQVRNGKGLAFTVSLQRGMDISRLSFRGLNCSFLSPAGYVAPEYFSEDGMDFLKSFTCGFLTTCGLRHVGPPCVDAGEKLTLHGTISNIPADNAYFVQNESEIEIRGLLRDEAIFGDKLQLSRNIVCDLRRNHLEIRDEIANRGDRETPLMLLYHFNAGYPLLSEKAELFVGSEHVAPRDAEAEKGIDQWQKIIEPRACYQEQCFYHTFGKHARAGIFNREIGIGFMMYYDTENLPRFTQWKMMGVRDYVMGLEPGNCNPEGRKAMRENGRLEFLPAGGKKEYCIAFDFFDDYEAWDKAK